MLFRTFCIDIGTTTVPDGLAACQACCGNSLQSHSPALQVHDQPLLHTTMPQASALHASPSLSCRTSVISMSLKTGIVGLPNVGKVRHLHNPSGLHAAESVMHLFCQCTLIGLLERPKSTYAAQSTLFNAICENGKAQAANFPFCTIEPNVGIVAVPDPRLQVRSNLDSRVLTFTLHPCRSTLLESCVQHVKPWHAQLMEQVALHRMPSW